jgi:toxin ParE1/3/4
LTVSWRARAKRDLRELISWIANDSVQTADLVADRIWKAVALLATARNSGRPGRVPGTRELVVSRTPYILVYRVRRSRVSILRLYRGARRWPARFD